METVTIPTHPFAELGMSATASTLPEPAALALWGCVLLAGAALLRHRGRSAARSNPDFVQKGRRGIAVGTATMAEAA